MKTIVNVDNNWGIGSNNDLLYHIPEDMKFFKEKTTGNVVIMGLATLMSFPHSKPLPNRVNIVLSADKDFTCEGAVVCFSIEEVLEEASKYDSDNVYIIGGASVYAQFIDYCDTAYITKVNSSKPADKFFPNLDEKEEWKITEESETFRSGDLEYKFCTYRKTEV